MFNIGEVVSGRRFRRLVWECECVHCGKLLYLSEEEILIQNGTCCHGQRPGRWKYGAPRREIPEYKVWVQIRSRCRNRKAPGYANYGGRGIRVCDRWNRKGGFANFFKDMGPRPEGMSLDRINNNGPYAPGNCRWATPVEQMRNRRTTRKATFNGETLTLYEWSEKLGVPYADIRNRIVVYKWPVDRALTEPVSGDLALISRNGRTLSLKRWSEELGIQYGTLLSRYHRGFTGDALFAANSTHRLDIKWRGSVYGLKELSSKTGIQVGTLTYRYRKGLREEELTAPVRGKK